ncbi:Rne/Rng family ribonuclease [Edaphobacter sp. 12200R-103]|uniref:Rne/Rng family ribonuclease n=1 Tax=Edaphobacter sp. 12200R-103 TaxID=2703788 RepID=UPI00138B271C|nr:Rne/Rng family ribonuclease [Edaphobacter sp. 12200R-103]QHS52099.1 Rne/Rng family ribonuclease [Edaphobacter sp. 12200R-103]
MSKEIYISSTPHETRLAIVENDALSEIYYERENEYTLAGSIYNGRVTRVLPGMQSSFVDIGLERDAFLYITDFMEEAGDSADFDSDGGQRGGRRDRGSRDQGGSSDGEASAAEEPTRGGRGRRRDRDRNRQELPHQAPSQQPTASDEYASEDGYAAESLEAPEELTSENGESIGEGAPGADGSRRWRGRRGRRRGRGRQNAAEPANDLSPEVAPEEPSYDFEATAEPVPAEAEAPVETEPQSTGREERTGYGDRDRGRGRRDRRTPRGFAPKSSLYGLEEASGPSESEGESQPIIVLPGESLSKYRTGGEPAEQAQNKTTPAVAAPTAPGYEIPAGWDGGFVLPGESLSRHRKQTAPAPVESEKAHAAEAAAEELPVSAVSLSSEEKTEPVEYEPTEASVSYRVDPVPPSEFRHSPSAEEEAPALEEAAAAHTELPHAEIEEVEHLDEPVAPLIVEATDESVSEIQTPVTAETAASHEVTSIHATGEMVSPAPVSDPVEEEAEHQAFEAGAGEVVEEEIFDEEEGSDAAILHASSIEELDDLDEEETLEGAADLGTMIREMSIDEITSAGVEDDEDDFEEEDAIDDSSFSTQYVAVEESEDDLAQDEFAEEGEPVALSEEEAAPAQDGQERGRDFERRRGRRDRRGRERRPTGGGEHERGGRSRGRSSMQATDMPAITELLKPGQEILVQIAKEPIAKKGARITSHIALPGRFLVFMPTVNHTGVSRKIESDGERRRLKEILLSEKGNAPGGFIVRTAAAGATEDELRSDLRFLLNLWADIKQRSESSKSPALIYHDLNLVERILRDQVTDNFSAIWVDTETEYERVLRFLQRFQPSLIRRVKLYTKETPLFEQFGIGEEINKALRSKVWLKSGGSIVINQTEALVAIDINTGKYVGKTARLEDTIVKTNLDAIPEIVRQIRLRDLGGIIIIDFIDMDERKNRNRVMGALEEELKKDRAPSKILQFNDFGLVAITRKRVKQSLERTLSTPCNICTGTGMVKSPVTVCNDIYIEMRKMAKHLDRGDVMLRVHPDVVKQLKSSTKWLQEMEEMVGKTILVKSDPSLHPEQFDIH